MEIPYSLSRAVTTDLTIFVVILLVNYMISAQQRPAKFDKHGRYAKIAYPAGFQLLGWMSMIVGLGLLRSPLFSTPPTSLTDWFLFLSLSVAFVLLGGGMLNELRRKLYISQKGILFIAPWSKDVTMYWEDVIEVSSGGEGLFKVNYHP